MFQKSIIMKVKSNTTVQKNMHQESLSQSSSGPETQGDDAPLDRDQASSGPEIQEADALVGQDQASSGPKKGLSQLSDSNQKDVRAAIKNDHKFVFDDREFVVLLPGAWIRGVGKLSAIEICVSLAAQKALVECLDARGSGIIREIF